MHTFVSEPGRAFSSILLSLGLLAALATSATAQTSPWTGVIADEARSDAPTADGATMLSPHALSGDGRYLVFHSERTLRPEDANGVSDVFLRDRFTGELTLVSVSSSGEHGNDQSRYPSISRNGRHIIFSSCATNLVADDTNGMCDAFIRDRELGTTIRVNVGVAGEQAIGAGQWLLFAISADGRYVAFTSQFNSSGSFQEMYFRDRDGDADGVFDEAEDSSTTAINRSLGDGEFLYGGVDTPAVSADGRWVAFSAGVMDAQSNSLGYRMFVHDRTTSTTVRIDRAPVSEGGFHSSSPDFSDTNELVYYTSVPSLDPVDTDISYDVYVFNLLTGGHTHITQTHDTEDLYHRWEHEVYPAITPDGRYVAFAGYGIQDHRDAYVVDRSTGASYTVNKAADGSVDPNGFQANYGMVSISDDGLAIAFEGSAAILSSEPGLNGIFVATPLDLSPGVIEASNEPGTYSFDVVLPNGVAWTLDTSMAQSLEEVHPVSGNGPTTVEVSVPENYSGEDQTHVIRLGSRQLTIHQRVPTLIYDFGPIAVSTNGNEWVSFNGQGFHEGVNVMFGDVPALEIVWLSEHEFMALAPPYVPSGWVYLAVTDASGASIGFEQENGNEFFYYDETPPQISPLINGTLGANNWYTSDVHVQWSVIEPESVVDMANCPELTLTTDTPSLAIRCTVVSNSGDVEYVDAIRRDATPPVINISVPQSRTYTVGESATVSFDCSDATAGIETCTASQSGLLNTSAAGAFSFIATATDRAGHVSTQTITYTVERSTPSLSWSNPGAIVYGTALGIGQLNASTPVAGSFAYNPAPGALLTTGTHTLSVTFTPTDPAYTSATANVTLTVTPAALTITANNASKVYGAPVPFFTATATGFVNGETMGNLNGTLAFSTTATSTSAPGSYTITIGGVSSSNYAITFTAGLLTVSKADTLVTLATSPVSTSNNQHVTMTASVDVVAPGSGIPSGFVVFRDNGTVIGAAPVVNGVAVLTERLKRGSHALTATYAATMNYNGNVGSTTHHVD
jgi:hypothetical protein